MRLLSRLILSGCCAELQPANLSKIDRTLKKEPAYKGKPKYCLLVFGPEATTRVWLVLDGETLYADLNGDRDLTAKGKRFTGRSSPAGVNHPDYPFQESHEFTLPDIKGERTYGPVSVMHSLLKQKFGPNWNGNDELKARRVEHPGLTRVGVTVHLRGKVRQQAVTDFAERLHYAPVLHFDGALTFAPVFAPALARGDKPTEIQVGLGTKGLGWDAFALLNYDEVPEGARPLAEVEFPSRKPGAKPLGVQLALDRC
jgi:hypothetical protein